MHLPAFACGGAAGHWCSHPLLRLLFHDILVPLTMRWRTRILSYGFRHFIVGSPFDISSANVAFPRSTEVELMPCNTNKRFLNVRLEISP